MIPETYHRCGHVVLSCNNCNCKLCRTGDSENDPPWKGVSFEMVTSDIQATKMNSILDTVKGLIPSNPVAAFAEGNMLQVLMFALIVGFTLIAIGEKGEPLLKVIDSCNEVCLKVISTVMYFTPIGVFCTIVPVVEAKWNEYDRITGNTADHSVCCILWICIYCVRRCSKFFGKTSPFKFFRAIMPAALNAFGTCSSSATIPISKSCVENELGVSNQISSIAIASFAALATMVGLPAGVMGVYISINTLCDMGATCVNVIGDMAGCVVLQEKIDLK